MTDKAFKRINGRGVAEFNWQKVKEAIVIGVGVSVLTAFIIGSVTWATSDRREIKDAIIQNREATSNQINSLLDANKIQEFNQFQIAERVNNNTILLYKNVQKDNKDKIPCPPPIKLKSYYGNIEKNFIIENVK